MYIHGTSITVLTLGQPSIALIPIKVYNPSNHLEGIVVYYC